MSTNNHNHNLNTGCTGDGGSCSCCDLTPKYSQESKKGLDKETKLNLIFLSISLICLILGFFDWHSISINKGVKGLLLFYYFNPSWIAIILCGHPIFINAIKSIKNKKLSSANLITLAMLASIALEIMGLSGIDVTTSSHSHSYIFAAGEIAWLMMLGEMLEDLTVSKCRSGIQRLISLIPKEANVLKEDGSIIVTKLEDVDLGDIVVVKPGELVSVDGVIIKGQASIDESSLTGEYIPKDVEIGDMVFGGTINKNGVIEIKVTKLSKDMTISKMAELTVEAEGKKAPISKLADKWVGKIVVIVLLSSILVGVISYFAFNLTLIKAIIRAVTILVVFCPCALALATPTAVAAGLGNAARNGVLIKSGEALENLSKSDYICLDKTGTITKGEIKLDKVVSQDYDDKELIKIVASIERYSEHPLAKAILEEAKDVTLYDVDNIKPLQGIGIIGEISGEEVLILSYKKAIDNNLDLSKLESSINESLSQGQTVVVVIKEGTLIGMLSFSDTIKDNAKKTMEELSNLGLKTMMLTGDNEKAANYIASSCGIKEIKHSLLPQDKLKEIENLQNNNHKVIMVGDGINDAPSLKLANSSFSMGAMGSDIAIDSADIQILNSDICKIVDTIKLSKRVIHAIKRNIIIAMTINVIAVILSLFGILTPVTGALVHNCTSVLVVASSALLLYNKKKK